LEEGIIIKTAGAKSTPGLTEEEQSAFIKEWIEPFQPKDFDEALHKLMAVRAVRALATPNNERLAQLLDKLLRAKWRVKVRPAEHCVSFAKPGAEKKEAV